MFHLIRRTARHVLTGLLALSLCGTAAAVITTWEQDYGPLEVEGGLTVTYTVVSTTDSVAWTNTQTTTYTFHNPTDDSVNAAIKLGADETVEVFLRPGKSYTATVTDSTSLSEVPDTLYVLRIGESVDLDEIEESYKKLRNNLRKAASIKDPAKQAAAMNAAIREVNKVVGDLKDARDEVGPKPRSETKPSVDLSGLVDTTMKLQAEMKKAEKIADPKRRAEVIQKLEARAAAHFQQVRQWDNLFGPA
ncbi:MAG: hypothetical protein V4689_06030 [Verrucomicrobiota bacterium]